jgi:hypothetical protein
MAQVDVNPTVFDPNHGLVVYRRRPRGVSVRRALNDGPILVGAPPMGNFGQWESIINSVITAAGQVGGAAVGAALRPRDGGSQAAASAGGTSNQPAGLTQAQLNALIQQAVGQATQTVQTIAGQETTPAHYQVPPSTASSTLSAITSNPTYMIGALAVGGVILYLLLNKNK